MGAKAALVSAATMLSRVLGLVREVVFAALFGASAGIHADAYGAAFRIPNLLRDLFAEGALSAAFVPAFTERMKSEGAQAAFRLANVVIGAVLVIVGAVALLGALGAPWIVHLLAAGFEETPGKFELTVTLTRVMMPFLPLVSLAAIVMGQLNAQERYGMPALAAASFNVVAIVAGLAIHAADVPPDTAVFGWAIATVLGGAVQFAVQVPALRRTGFRFAPRIDFSDPGLRSIALIMLPATMGLAATQLNIFVNTRFAAEVPGAVSWLGYAFRLMQLPIGVFGVAVATVAATSFAQRSAEKDAAGMSETLARGLRLVAFLTVPCTLGLAALGVPIVRLLYERRHFHASDTEAVALCTLMYAFGLYCYAAVKVVAPAFYTAGRPRVPLLASCIAVAANVGLNIALFPSLGYAGLALGTSVSAVANLIVLVVLFRRTIGPLPLRGHTNHFARVFVAGTACAATAWAANLGLETALGTSGVLVRCIGTLLPIAIGGAVYAAACRALGVAELTDVLARVRRRGAATSSGG